jgi:hypothetical protein
MALAAKLLFMLMQRFHRNGSVMAGDGKHVAAVFVLAVVSLLIALPALIEIQHAYGLAK